MGSVRGMVASDYRLFQSIPYAAPPVGPLRWQLPRPAARWPGMLDATKAGPQCMQDTGPNPRVGKPTSENCLTLNVWTPPRGQHNEKRPVMVWIHGGGFVNGSGDIYHSRWLAARGHIVVVTINYRLGALGFLAHPSLGPPGTVGNYGLADQQAALRWVRDNIAAFGGDPRKVTIAGESAGGMSVCDHLVAPGSAGLFRAAIIQSAPCQAQAELEFGQRQSVDYAIAAGCRNPATTARCLRALPATRLERPPWYYFIGDSDALSGPVTGTAALPESPVAGFAGRPRGPRSGADRRQPRRVHAFRGAAGREVGSGSQGGRVSACARRHLRRRRRRPGTGALSARSLRRRRLAGLLGGGHRRRFRLRRRPIGRFAEPQRAGLRLRVRRPARAGAQVPARRAVPGRRQPLVGTAIPVQYGWRASRWILPSRYCPTR